MRDALARWDARLRAGIDGAAALLLAAVTVLGIAQVIARYAFNASLVWSEEAIRLLYVWLVLIAAATAPHMRIALVSDRFAGRAGVILRLVQTAIMLALLGLLVNGAVTLNASFGGDRYVTLGLAKSWYWTGAIVGSLVWAGTILADALAGVRPDGEAR